MEKNYIDPEIAILEEVPYNWKKHFICNLPEMVYEICKYFIWFAIIQATMVAIISTCIAVALDIGTSEELKEIVENTKTEL